MKNKTLRNDLIILGILVVLIGGLFLFKSKQQGAKIVIKRNDQIEGYYSLDDEHVKEVFEVAISHIEHKRSML